MYDVHAAKRVFLGLALSWFTLGCPDPALNPGDVAGGEAPAPDAGAPEDSGQVATPDTGTPGASADITALDITAHDITALDLGPEVTPPAPDAVAPVDVETDDAVAPVDGLGESDAPADTGELVELPLSDGGVSADLPSEDVTVAPDLGGPDTTTTVGFGGPCEGDADCESGICVKTAEGGVCSEACGDACPSGWHCEAAGDDGEAFVCQPGVAETCVPCDSETPCPFTAQVCASLEGEGSYCVLPCGAGSPCGALQACQSYGADNDALGCMPTTGSCTCGDETQGQEKECAVENEFGSCAGSLTCTAEGWTECSAGTPAAETCGDDVDNDCDGMIDEPDAEGCTVFYADVDEDGQGDPASQSCLCFAEKPFVVTNQTDCDDTRAEVFLGAVETCNGLDDNCQDGVDEGLGGADCASSEGCAGTWVCNGDGGLVCDAPAASPEVCGDGIDNNCDGQEDEAGADGCVDYFQDGDGDGAGVDGTAKCLCGPQDTFGALKGGDCNDLVGVIHPGAKEVCNGYDDDCDGVIDPDGAEGCQSVYLDVDKDGFGVGEPACRCEVAEPWTATVAGDCADDTKSINPDGIEVCNGVDDNCDGGIDEGLGGGPCVGSDGACDGTLVCQGDKGLVCNAPAAKPEVCGDGVDNNCDGVQDEAGAEGCVTYFADKDQDQAGDSFESQCLCAPTGVFTAVVGGDCDDNDPEVAPGKVEVCNGKDDDCKDGADPEGAPGCETFYEDADGDTFGVEGSSKCLCAASFPFTATAAGDCDDDLPGVSPIATEVCNGKDDNCVDGIDEGLGGAACKKSNGFGTCTGEELCLEALGMACDAMEPGPEVCGDGFDNNCNGVQDEPGAMKCETWYLDADGDAVGGDLSKCLCGPDGKYNTQKTGDCQDENAAVGPLAIETCNGFDDNCDQVVDVEGSKGCEIYYVDADKDGFGVETDSKCLCGPEGQFSATEAGDCDDEAADVNPDRAEVCNGVDDNCVGGIDEGTAGGACQSTSPWGFCQGTQACNGTAGLSCNAPTAQEEVCDGADNDCDGQVDEGLGGASCVSYTIYGMCEGQIECQGAAGMQCNAPAPGPEVCDGKDNDCSDATNEAVMLNLPGCETWYRDADGDTYGDPDAKVCACGPYQDFVTKDTGDCNDSDPTVNPGATEVCNGFDDNCNLQDDEGTDGSPCAITNGFGTCPGAQVCNGIAGFDCVGLAPMAEVCNGKDDNCDGVVDEGVGGGVCTQDNANGSCPGMLICDAGGQLYCNAPAAQAETCDGKDNDCDGAVDEPGAQGCDAYYYDGDGDGWGVGSNAKCLCAPSGKYNVTQVGDCDDGDAAISPSGIEVCDGVDNNCVLGVDESGADGCAVFFADLDGDGFGTEADTECVCTPTAPYTATESADCNDEDPDVYPGSPEVCDGKLQDCDLPQIDFGCDDDGDDYCDGILPVVGTPPVCPKGGGDCVDTDPLVNPGQAEACDGKDNNCDGVVDEGVLAPCGGCVTECTFGTGAGGDGPFGELDPVGGTGKDADGNVVIDVNATSLAMLWVANSAESTVSRLDTETGLEVGRYRVGNNPSRTAVDNDGNCWVAARGDGRLMQIKRDVKECIDKNGDGEIQTSHDMNGNGQIDAGEILETGEDECVAWDLYPDGQGGYGTKARAIAVDAVDNVWVGFWQTKRLRRLSASTGQVNATLTLSQSGRPYGMVLDSASRLYVSARGNPSQIVMVETEPTIGTPEYFNLSSDAYGIAIDANGVVWVAGGSKQRIHWFDPNEKVVHTLELPKVGYARGVTATLTGDIFVARHTWTCKTTNTARYITKINAETKTVTTSYDLGGKKGPIGLATGFGGTLWSVNQCSSTAMKLNADTGEILGEYPTGLKPYTYSDMSGYLLKAIVSPHGVHVETYEGWETGTTEWYWVNVIGITDKDTAFEVRVRTADTLIGLDAAVWSAPLAPNPTTGEPPYDISVFGRFFQVQVQLNSFVPKKTPVLQKIEVKARHEIGTVGN